MSENTPQDPSNIPPTPPVPPAVAPGGYPPPSGYPAPGYAQQQPPAPYGSSGAYPYPAGPKTNALAITSLVSAIAAFVVLPFIASIVAVITGHIALRQLRTSGENGRGMALAGTIVGWVGIALGLILIVLLIVWVVFAANMAGPYSSYS